MQTEQKTTNKEKPEEARTETGHEEIVRARSAKQGSGNPGARPERMLL